MKKVLLILLLGIHTEKLTPGSFNTLERLDFSYNKAENQHNLICTRNFKTLKILIVTGNPFAFLGQHKGLEKEIYMRVGMCLFIYWRTYLIFRCYFNQ